MRFLEGGVSDILLATDFTQQAQRAFNVAVRMAWTFKARLHILHVNEEEAVIQPHTSAEVSQFLSEITGKRTEWMAGYEQTARELDVDSVSMSREGIASQTIIEVADEIDAGLIVMGTTGARGVTRFLHGTTTKRVLRSAQRPVVTVSPKAGVAALDRRGTFDHIVYPTDFSPASRTGLRVAKEMVRLTDARLTLAHVIRLPTVITGIPGEPPIVLRHDAAHLQENLQAQMDEVARAVECGRVETTVKLHADAAEGIAEVAGGDDVDLIVLPRHSHHGVGSLLFGRTAERLSKIAPVPVLLFTPRQG